MRNIQANPTILRAKNNLLGTVKNEPIEFHAKHSGGTFISSLG